VRKLKKNLVKNINGYIFLIFRIFENLFEFYWVIFEISKKIEKKNPTDPTHTTDPNPPKWTCANPLTHPAKTRPILDGYSSEIILCREFSKVNHNGYEKV
jgi:hypothetical protein